MTVISGWIATDIWNVEIQIFLKDTNALVSLSNKKKTTSNKNDALTHWVIPMLGTFHLLTLNLTTKHRLGVVVSRASLLAQVKNPPTRQETRIWSLGWEDPLGKDLTGCTEILTRTTQVQWLAWGPQLEMWNRNPAETHPALKHHHGPLSYLTTSSLL